MVKSVDKLLEEFNRKKINKDNSSKLTFCGVDGYDVYNITAPFLNELKTVIAGRVEKRDSEHSKIMFFEKKSEYTWQLIKEYPVFQLQDPYFTFVKGDLVLGGTEVFEDELKNLKYRAVKYRGKNINTLKKFFHGPIGMKDIRLCDTGEKIIVFTRPQGVVGGRGKIGFVEIHDLSELTIDKINSAPLLDQFLDDEWGGVNEVHDLGHGILGILGHIAKYDEDSNRHYYPMTFTFDTNNKKYSDINIICTRNLLADGESKRQDLVDVIFSGGLIFNEDETIDLYCGVSDAEAHKITLINPFI